MPKVNPIGDEPGKIEYKREFSVEDIDSGVSYAKFLAEEGDLSEGELNAVISAKNNYGSESGATV
jgi:hypothetical protein